MSTQNNPVYASSDITAFYANQLSKHGDSSQGVGWKNAEAQNIRFAQLVKVINPVSHFSINDLGCGTGQLYNFLLANGFEPSIFRGYDMLEEMIEAAKQSLLPDDKVRILKISNATEMQTSDYTVESGIFNVKYSAKESDWLNYVLSTVEQMNSKSNKGFAFNLLTKYSDKEYMQDYLYYADPAFYFDFCKRNFAKNVALLHDYDQYDFTIIVRKS